MKALTIGLLALVIAQQPPTGPPPGVLVLVGAHKLHLRCTGPSGPGPTVILEAGGGGYASGWSRVQDLLSPATRTCSYDRAGSGWSEPGPAPRTLTQEVFELHELLQAARVSGPFVLAGQSIGGLLVRLYTERYGSDVIGVVLVDPTHESSVLYNMKKGGWVRLRDLATGRPVPEPRLESRAGPTDDTDYLPEEFQLIYLSRNANPEPLGDRPLIVLAAGKQSAPPGTSDELWATLKQEKDEQKADLARLSRNSKLIRDPSSGHNIHVDNPQLVARAIEEVRDAATKGVRLQP
jgi:pimeloyl-ACP methyl ester carboxylesterase